MEIYFISLNIHVLMLMTALIARNMPALQDMLITLQEIGIKYGFYINEEKTKYVKMTATPSDKLPKVTIG
jgi:hypothetical protein